MTSDSDSIEDDRPPRTAPRYRKNVCSISADKGPADKELKGGKLRSFTNVEYNRGANTDSTSSFSLSALKSEPLGPGCSSSSSQAELKQLNQSSAVRSPRRKDPTGFSGKADSPTELENEFLLSILNDISKESECGVEPADVVFSCPPPHTLRSEVKQDWTYGTVNGPRLEHSFYVKPVSHLPRIYDSRKDVYVKNEIVSGFNHLLELVQGDKVEFKLHPPKSRQPAQNKPSAKGANIICFCGKRTFLELQSYFCKTKEKLENSLSDMEMITSLMSSEAIWFYFFNVTCDNDQCFEEYIQNLLELLFLLSGHMDSFPLRRREIFSLILEKHLIDSLSNQTLRQSYEYKFIECAVTADPVFLKDVIPWINRIMENKSVPFSGVLYRIMMKLADIVDLSDWKLLSQIPSIKEMLGDPLERVSYLRPIALKSGYKDEDDYLNVYYRLLRAECFSAIQRGIVDFRRGKLDPRDMDIYDKVALVDIDIDHTNILLSLQFTPFKSVNDWRKSKKLMFGNLLCLSIKGDFSDPIWLTVSERNDVILQNHNVIGTELISFHCSGVDSAKIIRNMLLHSGKMVMAESPTYFKSFQHILSSLKEIQLKEFSLYNDIVQADYHGMDGEEVVAHLISNCNLKKHLEQINYDEMEEHQQYAFWHALRSRLAIIQGPPGTGKTYVGAKLVHMFLVMQQHVSQKNFSIIDSEPDDSSDNSVSDIVEEDSGEPQSLSDSMNTDKEFKYLSGNRPILILTYKNHALDEFLKHCTEFCAKNDITRIGSQSKEESLEDCQLHVQIRNRDEFHRIPTRGIIEDTGRLFDELSCLLKKLQRSKVFNFITFTNCLSIEQLSMFANSALMMPWRWRPKLPNVPKNHTLLSKFREWKHATNDNLRIELLSHIIAINNFSSKQDRNKPYNVMQRFISCKLLDAFRYHWVPDKENVKKLARLQKMGAAFFNIVSKSDKAGEDCSADFADGDTADDFDEDYVNEQLSMRRSAFDDNDYKNNSSRHHRSQRLNRLARRMKENLNFGDKHVFTLSDFPENCQKDDGILATADVWKMSDMDKYAFIYSTLHINLDDICEEMNCILENIDIKQREKQSIDEKNKIRFLQNQRIVGATIIGASVHLSLIQKLAPKIVLVEEAAEVLEPCLVAVLTKHVEKLVLIGDHKQLKPQVDTYHLRREYNFHISMMERLIGLGFPYEKLVRQGRMRPEFSCLLKDIYPDYDDFEGLAMKNKVIKCLNCSMFFWSHQFDEIKDRSARNPGEANMVLALAVFLVASGIPEDNITILCAYLGQVQLVRKLYRELNSISTPSGMSKKKQINIRTIDEYQGDENRFVIISLTRSNAQKNIGFLQEIERRCVAQSRAKCGMYFVGNSSMFEENKTWKFIMNKMKTMNLVNDRLPICCFRHPNYHRDVFQSDDIKKTNINDKNQLMYYVHTKDNWCDAVCNVLFECELEEHRCKKLCTPRHDDSKCLTEVSFTFSDCMHNTWKKCYIKDEDMKCRVELTKKLECGHDKTTFCHNWLHEPDDIKCHEKCSKSYQCFAHHNCNEICHKNHKHYAMYCTAPVEFKYAGCNHPAPNHETICNKPQPPKGAPVCKFRLKYTSTNCGHKQSRFCSEKERCERQCERQRPDCGHRCDKKCFQPCIGGGKDCEICEIEHRKILEAAKTAAKLQLELCKQEAAKEDLFALIDVTDDSDVVFSVKEKCRVLFSLYSKSRVKDILGVWKVKCPSNAIKFWTFASNAFGPLKEELCSLRHGFIESSSMLTNADLFEQLGHPFTGYEFTKYASRSFTSDLEENNGQFTVFISEILLGDRLNMSELNKNFTASKRGLIADQLKGLKKNSVIDSKPHGPASYFVYNSSQILPTYIVHIKCEKRVTLDSMQGPFKELADGEYKYDLSLFNLRDESNPMCDKVRKAISLYQGDCSKRPTYENAKLELLKIQSVGVVVNRKCEKLYELKKKELRDSKQSFIEVSAYHATRPGNVESIVKTNLDPGRAGTAHGTVYGHGCYFSEHPEFSFEYGRETMFIFKLLLVKDKYTKVQPDGRGFCQQLVLNDTSMFKPEYVLYF